jgi:hypothetical protein
MERHCGDIGCRIKSRRYPYANIDKYVVSRAHLTQISLLYNVENTLSLKASISCDLSFTLPSCRWFSNVDDEC